MENITVARYMLARKIGRTVVDGGSIGIVVRYVGTLAASATVQVSASTLLFKVGATGSEVADTNVQVGATPGTIDLTNAAVATMQQLIQYINTVTDSTGARTYQAYLGDVLPGDSCYPGSAQCFTTLAATQVNRTVVPNGLALNIITANNLFISKSITDIEYPNGFKADGIVNQSSNLPYSNIPYKISEVDGIVSKSTFGSGTNTIEVHEVNPLAGTSTKLFSLSGGATTVQQLIDDHQLQIQSRSGQYLVVKMVGSVAVTGFLSVVGKVF